MLSEHARVGQLHERTIVLDSSKEKKTHAKKMKQLQRVICVKHL